MSKKEVKAAVMTEFGKIETRVFPYPQVPQDGMIVKMTMAGVCGTDKHIFDGRDPGVPLPIILGHENLGKAYEIGDGARKELEVHGEELSPGDRVTWYPALPCGKCWYCKWLPQNHPGALCSEGPAYGLNISCEKSPHLFGGYAEYVYIMPGTWIFKVPKSLPDEVAVLVDIFAATGGVKKAMIPYPSVKEGFGATDVVAIQGAGPIGLAAGMTAKLCGAYQIILLGAPEKRLKLAREFEIFDHIISIEEVSDPEERIKMVKDLTPGKVGPDLVVECTGVPSAVPEGLEMVRRGGVFVEIGSFVNTGETSISPFKHLCWKDIYLIGQYGCPPHYYDVALRFVEMAWKRGWPLDKIVTHRFPIDKAQLALQAARSLEGMKIVVVPE